MIMSISKYKSGYSIRCASYSDCCSVCSNPFPVEIFSIMTTISHSTGFKRWRELASAIAIISSWISGVTTTGLPLLGKRNHVLNTI